MKLILASNNAHKLAEMKAILSPYFDEIVSMKEAGIDHETVEDGKIRSVQVTGGCDGNLKGIASLVAGMDIDEAIKRMEGIRCGFKPTSCPDQMAKALRAFQSEHA